MHLSEYFSATKTDVVCGHSMKVTLAYGREKIELDIPKKNLADIIEPRNPETIANVEEELNRVLDNPHGPMLEDLSRGKSVCVLVEDHTRDEPHWELLSTVVPRLRDATTVQFIITTGSHEVKHTGNLEIVEMIHRAARSAKLENYDVVINDCQSEDVTDLGTTSRGTPVIINDAAVGHELFVPLADMKAHYFAGYSNALKDFLPGICAFASIEANHSMALDVNSTFGRHPYHPIEDRRNNPLADDMREAFEMITKDARVFTLSVISAGEEIAWANAGEVKPVIASGIEVLDETTSFTIKPTPKIVVSPGGYPQDKSLYHAQRGLELTKNAVSDGGEILFLAECRDGIGPGSAIENFYNKLTMPLDQVIDSISDEYKLYQHKAYKFAQLLKRVSSIDMYTDLEKDDVEAAHLNKVFNPQETIDRWLEEDPDVIITVLDKANKIAVYAS